MPPAVRSSRRGRPRGSYDKPSRRIRVFVRLLRLVFTAVPRKYTSEHDDSISTYRSFGEIPRPVVEAVADAYVRVFADPPWKHRVPPAVAVRKLGHDLASPGSWLTVLEGSEPGAVAGFCWGAVIPAAEIPRRVIAGSNLPESAAARLRTVVDERIRADRVVFVDEIALVRGARGPTRSVESFIKMGVPLLEIAAAERAGIVCWTLRRTGALTLLNRLFLFEVVDVIGQVCVLWVARGGARDLAVLATRLGFRRIYRIGRFTSRRNEPVREAAADASRGG